MKVPFPEMLLQTLWHLRKLPNKYRSTQGEDIFIQKQGFWNQESGPDFQEARVQIDGVLWLGQIEFHLCSSDWYKHNHHHDKAYDSVVLHVVYHHDKEVLIQGGVLSTIELKSFISDFTIASWQSLQGQTRRLSCVGFSDIPSWVFNAQLDRMAMERMVNKLNTIRALMEGRSWDWNQVYWYLVCRFLGGFVNKEGFSLLGEQISWTLLKRLDSQRIPVLLQGFASGLNVPSELLEFEILVQRFGLEIPTMAIWKFGKTRPGNQLKTRLKQLVHFAQFWEANQFKMVAGNREALGLAFGFSGKVSPGFLDGYKLNVVSLFLGLKGQEEQAVLCQEEVTPEENRFTRVFNEVVQNSDRNGFRTQGMNHLWNSLCAHKKCLNCGVGQFILIQKNDSSHS